MTAYFKWMIIGLLIGVGISVGWSASDYYIDTAIFGKDKDQRPREIKKPTGLVIERAILVKTPLTFQVVGMITNKSDNAYRGAVVRAAITHKNKLIDYCEGTVTAFQAKADFKVGCDVSHNEYPEAELGPIEVMSVYVE